MSKSTRIGTTIHDEQVTVSQFRGGWVMRYDGRKMSATFATEDMAIFHALHFVPTHRIDSALKARMEAAVAS